MCRWVYGNMGKWEKMFWESFKRERHDFIIIYIVCVSIQFHVVRNNWKLVNKVYGKVFTFEMNCINVWIFFVLINVRYKRMLRWMDEIVLIFLSDRLKLQASHPTPSSSKDQDMTHLLVTPGRVLRRPLLSRQSPR